MKTICVIPARLKSSRLPKKLLAMVRGKTILQRTFENVSRCTALDGLYVATEDEEIAHHIEHLGGQVIWTSSHCKNGTERIAEALQSHPELKTAEIIVNVQGDHPCTSPETIYSVVDLLKRDSEAVMSTAVIPLTDPEAFHSPHVVKCVFDSHFNALYFSRSPIPYSRDKIPRKAYHHLGIYAYRTHFLPLMLQGDSTELQKEEDLEQLKALEMGAKIKVALVNDLPIGIDTLEDLKKFEEMFSQV